MNAIPRKRCTDYRPCNLMTCYACRRRQIDQVATAMLGRGTDQQSVDSYRYSAINNLAFEVAVTKLKAQPARPRKAPVLNHSDAYYAQVAKALANATSRELAAELLDDGLTVNDLNHIWTLAGRTDRIPSKLRKAERVEHMIENLVGYRLDSEAIRTGAMS